MRKTYDPAQDQAANDTDYIILRYHPIIRGHHCVSRSLTRYLLDRIMLSTAGALCTAPEAAAAYCLDSSRHPASQAQQGLGSTDSDVPENVQRGHSLLVDARQHALFLP
jgi:hypothetical protein